MKPTIFKRATALLLVTAMVLIAIPCFPLTINAVDNITDVNQMGCLGQTYNMLGDAIIGKGDGTKNIFVNLDSVTAQFFPYKSSSLFLSVNTLNNTSLLISFRTPYFHYFCAFL